jgi:hypothetical protein
VAGLDLIDRRCAQVAHRTTTAAPALVERARRVIAVIQKVRGRRKAREAVPGRRGEEDRGRRARREERRDPGRRPVIEGQRAAQQRTPGEGDRQRVGTPDELHWRLLGRGEDERRIRQAALAPGSRGAAGCLDEPGGTSVQAEDEGRRLGCGARQDGSTITGPEVDMDPARAGSFEELADVHLEDVTADDGAHVRILAG